MRVAAEGDAGAEEDESADRERTEQGEVSRGDKGRACAQRLS